MLTIALTIYIILAFLGLLDTIYISKKTRNNKTLICPLGFKCNEVVNSKWNSVFGISNDVSGLVFYQGVLLIAVSAIFFPSYNYYLYGILKFASIGAALFSIYLTYIQVVKIKNYCLYCLISASISILMFVTSLYL